MIQEHNPEMNFSAWYELNKDNLPEKLNEIMDKHHETMRFVAEDYMRRMKIISTALHELSVSKS
jgi:hypothetical protein